MKTENHEYSRSDRNELLHNVMAWGRKDFLYRPLQQWCCGGLFEKVLSCLSRGWWRGWSGLSVAENSLLCVLLSTTIQKAELAANMEQEFLITLFNLLALLALMLLPQQTIAKNSALATTHVNDLQHFAPHIEGFQLPQEVGSAHPLFKYSITVGFHIQILMVTILHLLSQNPQWSGRCYLFPEVNHHLFDLVNIQLQVIASSPLQQVVHQHPVVTLSSHSVGGMTWSCTGSQWGIR